ncbi:MAG TPA: hypothetical protein VGK53_11445 [Propionicimonas sp.]|jgi:hypothetical protein
MSALILIAGCASAAASPSAHEAGTASPDRGLPTFPPETRLSSGGPEPRSPGYWVTWSTCGAESQAGIATANGGRPAGWILLDDLLADPGMFLGRVPIEACDAAVAVLTDSATPRAQPAVRVLARQLLTAELNVSSGAETCPAAEATIGLGQAMLTRLDYHPDALFPQSSRVDSETATELALMLSDYNQGLLCR